MNGEARSARRPGGRFHRPRSLLLSLLGVSILASSGVPGSARAQHPGPPALRVAVISDLNGSYGSTEYERSVRTAVERIVALQPDLVISTGDMVAGQRIPHLSRGELLAMWTAFHGTVTDPLAAAGIPLIVAPGNHDASDYRGFGAEREAFREEWSARRPAVDFVDGSGYPFRYSFAAGDVLFVALDATTVGPLAAGQKEWLAGALSGADDYRHRVAFLHVPLWPLAQGRRTEFLGDPELEGILAAGGVEVVLTGHQHAFYPGARGGLVQLGQACLGAGRRPLLGQPAASQQGFTWLEFEGEAVRAAGLVGAGMDRILDWKTLPERLGDGSLQLVRADLAGGSLRPLAAVEMAALPPRGGEH